ncbi:MAG: hypothetical protein MHPSP_004457, partial [Paramarteilia canceri]
KNFDLDEIVQFLNHYEKSKSKKANARKLKLSSSINNEIIKDPIESFFEDSFISKYKTDKENTGTKKWYSISTTNIIHSTIISKVFQTISDSKMENKSASTSHVKEYKEVPSSNMGAFLVTGSGSISMQQIKWGVAYLHPGNY